MTDELRTGIVQTALGVALFYRTLRQNGVGAGASLALSVEYVRCVFATALEHGRVAHPNSERYVFMRPEEEAA